MCIESFNNQTGKFHIAHDSDCPKCKEREQELSTVTSERDVLKARIKVLEDKINEHLNWAEDKEL